MPATQQSRSVRSVLHLRHCSSDREPPPETCSCDGPASGRQGQAALLLARCESVDVTSGAPAFRQTRASGACKIPASGRMEAQVAAISGWLARGRNQQSGASRLGFLVCRSSSHERSGHLVPASSPQQSRPSQFCFTSWWTRSGSLIRLTPTCLAARGSWIGEVSDGSKAWLVGLNPAASSRMPDVDTHLRCLNVRSQLVTAQFTSCCQVPRADRSPERAPGAATQTAVATITATRGLITVCWLVEFIETTVGAPTRQYICQMAYIHRVDRRRRSRQAPRVRS